MARPIRDGIDYFSFDTDFFADDKVKLIRSEFGAKGVMLLIYLFCEIYRGEGYYKIWDNDSCLLVSDGAACGCTPDFTSQVINGCIRRSLFDDKLFNVFGVLTSSGIQRRFLRACSTRDEIRIRQEYWLLDVNNKKDVPPGILKKITFISEKSEKTGVSLQNNPVNLQNNPKSKVKESKGKKRESQAADAAAPSLDEVKAYCKGKKVDPERFWNYYAARGWKIDGEPIENWRALINNWEKTERPKTSESESTHKPSYDLNAYEKYDIFGQQESKEQKK